MRACVCVRACVRVCVWVCVDVLLVADRFLLGHHRNMLQCNIGALLLQKLLVSDVSWVIEEGGPHLLENAPGLLMGTRSLPRLRPCCVISSDRRTQALGFVGARDRDLSQGALAVIPRGRRSNITGFAPQMNKHCVVMYNAVRTNNLYSAVQYSSNTYAIQTATLPKTAFYTSNPM